MISAHSNMAGVPAQLFSLCSVPPDPSIQNTKPFQIDGPHALQITFMMGVW
jgi:hypothetical protein